MKPFITFLALVCLIVSCGKKSDTSGDGTTQGPIVSSAKRGLLVASVQSQGLRSADILAYTFASGTIKKLFTVESSNVVLARVGSASYIFDRSTNPPHYRSFDPDTGSLGAKVSLTGFVAGDPYRVHPLTGDRVLLLGRLSGSLKLWDLSTGALVQNFSSSDFSTVVGTLRPAEAGLVDNRLYLAHHNVDAAGIAAGPGKLLAMAWEPSVKTLSPVGDFSMTLDSTFPEGIFDLSPSSAKIIGFCTASKRPQCSSGVETLTFSGSKSTPVAYDITPYGLHAGSKQGVAAGHTLSSVISDSGGAIIDFDLTGTEPPKELHRYAPTSDRLYDFIYDDSGQTLFVGDENNEGGLIEIYGPTGVKKDTATISGAPFSMSFY